MLLHVLGWDSSLDSAFAPHRGSGFIPARVAEEHRDRYIVFSEQGELGAEASGRLRFTTEARHEMPAVGDWVALQPSGHATAIIHALLPRRNAFLRKVAGETTEAQVIAANIDTVFVVTDADRDFNPRRMERYLTLAYESGVAPVIVLNKADLTDRVDDLIAQAGMIAAGVSVCALSALTGEGIDALAPFVAEGRTVALIGSSGVGKSTLVNRLLGEERLKTSRIRESDGRGRHTTSRRQLLLLPAGALVIDTPGMREIQIWADEESLQGAFQDVESFGEGCRFRDCRHEGEPGCAVERALAEGSLSPGRLEGYRKLRREIRWLERKQDVLARIEERSRWKAIRKSGREHMRRKYGE
jgi:ribosome biogenesis GTPase